MLLPFTLFLFCTVVIIVAASYAVFFTFLYRLERTDWKKPVDEFLPKTMVLFPLRGADPSLMRSLEKILTQDYPNYRVRFILDSPEDSALPFVEAAIKQWGAEHGELKIMTEYFSTCALKCSAHIAGMADLDPSFEVIAVLDADTNPPADWLKRLVEPLADPHFPAATAVRWYIPDQANPGSLVRYLWNAAAIVMQYFYRIPWGGSMTLRRELFTKTDLIEQWKHALTDDNSIVSAVHQVQGKIAVVPSLFLVNRETCSLVSFHRWVQRQLFLNKLYTPAWGAIVAQSILISLPLCLLILTFFAGLVFGDMQVVFLSAFAFLFYWAGVFGTLPIIENTVRHIVRQHGETAAKWSFRRTMLTFAMVPVTQAVYTSAIICLHFIRKIEWRGIEYKITGKNVRMIEYKPYTVQPGGEGQSL